MYCREVEGEEFGDQKNGAEVLRAGPSAKDVGILWEFGGAERR